MDRKIGSSGAGFSAASSPWSRRPEASSSPQADARRSGAGSEEDEGPQGESPETPHHHPPAGKAADHDRRAASRRWAGTRWGAGIERPVRRPWISSKYWSMWAASDHSVVRMA